MPVSRISVEPNRPDLATLSGTAQLVSHLAYHALRSATMHPVNASEDCPTIRVKGDKAAEDEVGESPCLQAAAFSGAGWTAWAVLNICHEPVPSSLVTATAGLDAERRGGSYEVTTYDMHDPGGWAPLPKDPSALPWSSGPLKPTHVSAAGAPPEAWPAPALSFSIVLVRAAGGA